jgi:hypothetical protein
MVQVGVLYREELKQAIMKHPLWDLTDPQPIFDLYVSDFIAENKSRRCYLSQQRDLNKTW